MKVLGHYVKSGLLSVLFLFFKTFRNAKVTPKFGRGGGCVLMRKNFQNGVPARSVTKIPPVVIVYIFIPSYFGFK
jgi:hypothetical protein